MGTVSTMSTVSAYDGGPQRDEVEKTKGERTNKRVSAHGNGRERERETREKERERAERKREKERERERDVLVRAPHLGVVLQTRRQYCRGHRQDGETKRDEERQEKRKGERTKKRVRAHRKGREKESTEKERERQRKRETSSSHPHLSGVSRRGDSIVGGIGRTERLKGMKRDKRKGKERERRR
jgi:hypothetical protein